MPGSIDGLRRIVSPITLLLGVVCFLLPFCALSCNSGGLVPSGDLVSASGVKLAFGGDASFNCDYITQLGTSISNAFNSGTGGSSSSSSSSNPCSPSTGSRSSSAPSAAANPNPFGGSGSSGSSNLFGGSGSNQKVGPFDGPGSNGTSLHVGVQPIALIAVILLVLGAGFAAVSGRAGMLGGALAAVGAAVALVVLRISLGSSFTSDLKGAASSTSSSSTSSAFSINGFDPSAIFQLTWGIGWWLALLAAIVGAAMCGIALAATGSASHLATVPPGGAHYGQVPRQPSGWGPPQAPPPQQPQLPQQPQYGQWPPQFGAPPPQWGQPPPQWGQPPPPPAAPPPQQGGQPPGPAGYPPQQG